MKVLLSIRSHYVKKIITGEKRYEYRKIIFKRNNIDSIIVYSSGDIKKIVGEIKFKKILSDTPAKIWSLTHERSGMTKGEFFKYYSNKHTAFAIVIDSFIPYREAVSLDVKFPGVRAPQSFRYIDEED